MSDPNLNANDSQSKENDNPITTDLAWKATRLSPRCEEARLLEILQDLDLAPYRRLAENAQDRHLNLASVSTGRAQAAEWFARHVRDSNTVVWYLD
jgi:hypothetical protein